jgi:hypothetical protein
VWKIGFVIDLLQTAVGLYGGFLFLWWWMVLGRASNVYAMVMVIFFGFSFQNAVALYHRHHLLISPDLCSEHMTSFQWYSRDLPTTIGLVMLVILMTRRAAATIRDIREFKKGGKKNEETTLD